jgi:hypothetical protein
MKKLIITLSITSILIISAAIFYSCEKEEKTNNDMLKRYAQVFLDYELLVHNSVKNFTADSVAFSGNPFDEQGTLHNKLLNEFFTRVYDLVDSSEYIEYGASIAGLPAPNNLDSLILNLFLMASNIYSSEGYNSSFINSLSQISATEKEIINQYFDHMAQLSDYRNRVALSKEVEAFVIKESSLSSPIKDRVLSCFAVYRYSTYFWAVDQNLSFALPNLPSFMDAAARYQYVCCDITWLGWTTDDIQDGADLYRYTYAVSLFYAIIFHSFSSF